MNPKDNPILSIHWQIPELEPPRPVIEYPTHNEKALVYRGAMEDQERKALQSGSYETV